MSSQTQEPLMLFPKQIQYTPLRPRHLPAPWGDAWADSASAAERQASCPHTLCPRFSCLHVLFPVAPPPLGVRQRPSPAGLPGFCLLSLVLVWMGKSSPGATACLRSLESAAQSLRRQILCPKQPGLFLGWEGGMLTLLTHGCLMRSPLVQLGRKNL